STSALAGADRARPRADRFRFFFPGPRSAAPGGQGSPERELQPPRPRAVRPAGLGAAAAAAQGQPVLPVLCFARLSLSVAPAQGAMPPKRRHVVPQLEATRDAAPGGGRAAGAGAAAAAAAARTAAAMGSERVAPRPVPSQPRAGEGGEPAEGGGGSCGSKSYASGGGGRSGFARAGAAGASSGPFAAAPTCAAAAARMAAFGGNVVDTSFEAAACTWGVYEEAQGAMPPKRRHVVPQLNPRCYGTQRELCTLGALNEEQTLAGRKRPPTKRHMNTAKRRRLEATRGAAPGRGRGGRRRGRGGRGGRADSGSTGEWADGSSGGPQLHC
ncbi:MAG: hypothetical protein J3K34DRAFT_512264, partial [Monoraphidium minutum]